MEAAPVFASTAITSGLPPVPGTEQARAIAYGHAALAGTAEAVQEASMWVAPLRSEIARVIVGQKYLIDRLLIALIANGHVLLEACPAWPRRWRCAPSPPPCRWNSAGSNSHPTCCQRTSSARRFTIHATAPSTRSSAPSLRTLCWRMKSTARRPRYRVRCSRRCRNGRSRSAKTPTSCLSRSSSWPRRIRSSRKALIRCPRRRSIASCSRSW